MIGHATFCVVVVYNNVVARLRRTSASLTEASMDLGADGWQTFRFVTLPTISTALISGALLAFALSFDEVIVTTFTAGAQNTLPIWIFGQIALGQPLPQVNVVVFVVSSLTIIPVFIAQRLTRESGILRTEDWEDSMSMTVASTRTSSAASGSTPSTGETMEVLNPATGETIAEVPRCGAEDVDRAVAGGEDGAAGVARDDAGRARRGAARSSRT